MKEFRFNLNISWDEFMAYYEGVARDVVAVSDEGLTVRFSAYVLRLYLTGRGIRGEFILECDEHNKFSSIRRVKKR
ncbi:MAG: DUF2835 family protein [Deltaproteobacteria bacterium]|nr:DUF2835 family protein [Deltaproteobacteria bacterium]